MLQSAWHFKRIIWEKWGRFLNTICHLVAKQFTDENKKTVK